MKIGLQAWGSEGDIQPFTALAAGLVKANHEVTLVVTDNMNRDYSNLARRFGYEIRNVPNPVIASVEESEKLWREIIELGNPIKQAEHVLRYGLDPVANDMYSAAVKLCSENEIVVGHFFAYPLRIAAEIKGIPNATVNIVHNCIPSRYICPPGFPNLGQWSFALGWKIVNRMINSIFLPRVNSLRIREGLTPENNVMTETWASKELNLIAVSPLICNITTDWEDRHKVCGFLNPPANLISDELPAGLDNFLISGEPPVYFTFGSMLFNSYQYLKDTFDIWNEAVKLAGCRAIIQLPTDDLGLFNTDDNILKVSRAPYKKVFQRCAMVVHHGGAGTTQSALLTGTPVIIVAHVSDQFFWGSEMERLGVAGKTLKRKGLRSKQLASGIKNVLTHPEMASRAQAIGNEMAKEDGVRNAVQLIENLGKQHC